jgi:hypothetical protein
MADERRKLDSLLQASLVWQGRALQREERLRALEAGSIVGDMSPIGDSRQERDPGPVRNDSPVRAAGPDWSRAAPDRSVMAVTGEAMTEKNPDKYNAWMWQPADAREIPASGDVVVRAPKEGWSPGFYTAVLQHCFSVRGAYPRTARMHPSTALAVAPTDGVLPVWWPVSEVRRHYAPARIILSDDAPQLLESREKEA